MIQALSSGTSALALASGAIVGALLALFGGGGSVLATPLLLYVVGLRDPHVALGTSTVAVAFNATVNLAGHWRGGRVRWPCALVFAAAGLAGSVAGSTIGKHVEGQRLLLFFACAMAAIAVSMLRKPRTEGNAAVRLTPSLAVRLVPIAVVTGFAAGFFGIGGGFLIVPGLMAAVDMTMSNAAASSLVSVALFGAATATNYAVSGLVDWPVAGIFILGGLAGSLAGLRGARILAARVMLARRLFAGLILAVAAYVAWRALSA